MEQAREQNKGGRPKGRPFPLGLEIYLDQPGRDKLERLAAREGESLSAAVRRLLREAK